MVKKIISKFDRSFDCKPDLSHAFAILRTRQKWFLLTFSLQISWVCTSWERESESVEQKQKAKAGTNFIEVQCQLHINHNHSRSLKAVNKVLHFNSTTMMSSSSSSCHRFNPGFGIRLEGLQWRSLLWKIQDTALADASRIQVHWARILHFQYKILLIFS